MKRIGLIVGPHTEAIVRYLRQLEEQVTDRFGDESPVRVLVYSIGGRAFESAMQQPDAAQAQRMCVAAARQCAAAGADAVLLGHSQLHVAADAVRESVDIPLVDLVDATLAVAANAGVRRLALLGIRYPKEDSIWQSRCEGRGLIAAVPPAETAARVSAIVLRELCRGFVDGASKAELIRFCADFRREGARAVVLTAPELRLALGAGDSVLPVLDATEVHVSAAIDWAMNGKASPRFQPGSN